MSRSKLKDLLQNHLFWALDVSSFREMPVFTPLFGFSAITGPKINVEVETIKDGTYMYPRHVVKGASISPITFRRAATLYDSDFYNWVMRAIYGADPSDSNNTSSVKRDILIVQFARINMSALVGDASDNALGSALGAGALAALVMAAEGSSALHIGGAAGVFGAGGALSATIGDFNVGIGPFAFASWLPARAWLLHRCLPTSYVAATDFDATSADVSLMDLEVHPEYVEEFSMGL